MSIFTKASFNATSTNRISLVLELLSRVSTCRTSEECEAALEEASFEADSMLAIVGADTLTCRLLKESASFPVQFYAGRQPDEKEAKTILRLAGSAVTLKKAGFTFDLSY